MSNTQRLMGQDVEVFVVNGNTPLLDISDVKSLDITIRLDKKQEGFLGQTSDKFDTLYIGVNGKISFEMKNADAIDFAMAVKEKAQNRRSSKIFSIRASYRFPDGSIRLGQMRDVSFGDIPINTGGRGEYVKMDLDFSASDILMTSR